MRTERWDEDGRVAFVLAGLDDRYRAAARGLGFGEERDAFARWFPAGSTEVDRAYDGFTKAIGPMLRQKAGEEPVPWADALRAVIAATDDQGVDWWLVGSEALAVLAVMAPLLSSALVAPVAPVGETPGWFCAWWCRVFVGACVDIAGDTFAWVDQPEPADFGPHAVARLESVVWEGHRLRVPPLGLQRAVNLRRRRQAVVAAFDWTRRTAG